MNVTLLRAYCQSFYTCYLWIAYPQKVYHAQHIQYNNGFRMLLELFRCCGASTMFAEAQTDGFQSIMSSGQSWWTVYVMPSNWAANKYNICNKMYLLIYLRCVLLIFRLQYVYIWIQVRNMCLLLLNYIFPLQFKFFQGKTIPSVLARHIATKHLKSA